LASLSCLIGEVLGLWWGSVSLRQRVITVERSRLGTTNTKRARRIYINDVLYDALPTVQKKATGEYVFRGEDGQIRKDVRGALNAAIRKTCVRRIRIHDMWHTFASHLMMKSGNILTLHALSATTRWR
jgi:integrase